MGGGARGEGGAWACGGWARPPRRCCTPPTSPPPTHTNTPTLALRSPSRSSVVCSTHTWVSMPTIRTLRTLGSDASAASTSSVHMLNRVFATTAAAGVGGWEHWWVGGCVELGWWAGGRVGGRAVGCSVAGGRGTCPLAWRPLWDVFPQLLHCTAQRLGVLLSHDDRQLQGGSGAQLRSVCAGGAGAGVSGKHIAARAHTRPSTRRPTTHHAARDVHHRGEARDDGAEALLHVAHQQRGLRGHQPPHAATARGAAGHRARCSSSTAAVGVCECASSPLSRARVCGRVRCAGQPPERSPTRSRTLPPPVQVVVARGAEGAATVAGEARRWRASTAARRMWRGCARPAFVCWWWW